MNRREFIAGAVASLALLSVGEAAPQRRRHLWIVWDSCEEYWYSAFTEAEVRQLHLKQWIEPAGLDPEDEPDYQIQGVGIVPPHEQLEFCDMGPNCERLTMTAKEWAAWGTGFIATSAGF